jgi:hypothetical protein
MPRDERPIGVLPAWTRRRHDDGEPFTRGGYIIASIGQGGVGLSVSERGMDSRRSAYLAHCDEAKPRPCDLLDVISPISAKLGHRS